MNEITKLLQEAEKCKNSINVDSALELVRRLTDERKILNEALKRVQGRCTELEMERRRLVAELAKEQK